MRRDFSSGVTGETLKSETIKRNHSPHYNRPVTLLGGRFGRWLPVAQTRSRDITATPLEGGWGVATASFFF